MGYMGYMGHVGEGGVGTKLSLSCVQPLNIAHSCAYLLAPKRCHRAQPTSDLRRGRFGVKCAARGPSLLSRTFQRKPEVVAGSLAVHQKSISMTISTHR